MSTRITKLQQIAGEHCLAIARSGRLCLTHHPRCDREAERVVAELGVGCDCVTVLAAELARLRRRAQQTAKDRELNDNEAGHAFLRYSLPLHHLCDLNPALLRVYRRWRKQAGLRAWATRRSAYDDRKSGKQLNQAIADSLVVIMKNRGHRTAGWEEAIFLRFGGLPHVYVAIRSERNGLAHRYVPARAHILIKDDARPAGSDLTCRLSSDPERAQPLEVWPPGWRHVDSFYVTVRIDDCREDILELAFAVEVRAFCAAVGWLARKKEEACPVSAATPSSPTP